jgi:putative colanic acid biosynthesis UDP-glucose lipid carrier transferase
MFMFVKRSLDIIFSVAFLVLLAPWLFGVIALSIKLDSKGPVFFVQERGGLGRKRFRLYKFRTLRNGIEAIDTSGGYKELGTDSSCITRVGRFLRITGLDELPQFFNILRGDMSLIGPRPHPVAMDKILSGIIPRYYERLKVKPGLTGWAQVNGCRGPSMNPRVMEKRLTYDLWYIKHQSFWLDGKIIGLTIKETIRSIYKTINKSISD